MILTASRSATGSSIRAASPAPTPVPELSPGSDKTSTLVGDSASNRGSEASSSATHHHAGDASKYAPETATEKDPTLVPDDPTDEAPAAASSEATGQDAPTQTEALSSPTQDNAITLGEAAEEIPDQVSSNTAPPYPTTPPTADTSIKEEAAAESPQVQMPLTPEELVDKVVEEIKKKGLVG